MSTHTHTDPLVNALIADGTMLEVTLAGTPTPMIASLVNAQALARASARMLAHLAGAWCEHERPHTERAQEALARADAEIQQVFMTLCCDEDEDE